MKREKHFFDSPAKTIVSILCAIPLLLIFIAGITFIVNMIAKKTSIGANDAKNYAFADAGIHAAEAHAVHTEFEFEDGHFAYEVSFFANNTEYEYVVKASDGTILEREAFILPQTQTTNDTANTTGTDIPFDTSSYIDVDFDD
ncbi:MAG: PepSY domain-containing protein [Lachnospiraceae bacterium]|nr:PepSY domain-containing protein [Lachnospiraceae bacterium]